MRSLGWSMVVSGGKTRAAILASGLMNLARLKPDEGKPQEWRRQALAMLESLWHNYSSRGSADPCILLHGTRSKPEGMMDHGLIYGDYYFVEALTKLARADFGL